MSKLEVLIYQLHDILMLGIVYFSPVIAAIIMVYPVVKVLSYIIKKIKGAIDA